MIKMRDTASSKHIYDDFPAIIALLSSFEFWLRFDDDPALCRNFIQIVFNPQNYGLSFDRLEDVCGYREKTIRTHCKMYMQRFWAEYRYFSSLPLPLLISRYIEFNFNPSIHLALDDYFVFALNEIPQLVANAPIPAAEKELCLAIYNHFTEQIMDKAG